MLYHSCIWESKFLDTRSEYYYAGAGMNRQSSLPVALKSGRWMLMKYIGWAQGVYVFNNNGWAIS